MARPQSTMDTEKNFLAKIVKDEASGCWNWIAGMVQQGYGQFSATGRPGLLAHRWAYEHWVCPILPGFVIDHLCRNRKCVNPEHLEAVTQGENVRRWRENPLPEHQLAVYEEKRRSRREAFRQHFDPEVIRFFRLVEVEPGGCWLWWGKRTEDGYALFGPHGRRAHRWSYERFLDRIPDGLQLDHLCSVRHCVNPWHLEAVTCRENTLRGDTVTGNNAKKTHCPLGHALDGKNLYVDARGSRACKICRREAARASYLRMRENPERLTAYHVADSQRQHDYKEKKKGSPLGVPNAKKTHCSKGHAFTAENISWQADGSRRCRTCIRENDQRRRHPRGYDSESPEAYGSVS